MSRNGDKRAVESGTVVLARIDQVEELLNEVD
jgi:hypothetical protein